MKSSYKRLGDFIHKVENRNTDLKVEKLLGLSMTKEFRETTSNIVGTDMSVYKIMSKWQFACDFMSVIRVYKLPVVLKNDDEPIIVSPAYTVFEVNNPNELHPEYLMMWFRRAEFDRYAVFKCDSAIRGGFDWEELCDTTIPVPSIEKQREIVKEYNVIVDRINLNNRLIQKLEETAQAIYKQWFVDFEFPDENGNPYKSNGGEMIESELGEIPNEWKVAKMNELYDFQYGAGNNNPDNGGDFPVYGSNGIIGGYDYFNNEDSPVIGHIGANCGSLIFATGKNYVTYNGVMCKIKNGFDKYFGYIILFNKDLKSNTRGTSQPFISYDMLNEIDILIPNSKFMKIFCSLLNPIFDKVFTKKNEIKLLIKLKYIILSKLAIIN